MIQTIGNFFNSIWSIIQSIVSFVVSLVQGLITMITSLPQILATATQAIGYLPAILTAFATLTITISIIYLIIGRNTGDS